MAPRQRFDVAARRSCLTGAMVGSQLHEAGMSAETFATIFGVPAAHMHRVLAGDLDGKILLILEVALEYAARHGEELRRRPTPFNVGINRRGYRLTEVSGWDIYRRLRDIMWSVPDFARFIGMTDRTIRNLLYGSRDDRIPLLLERVLEFVERHPLELQARPRVQTPKRQSPARREALCVMRQRLGQDPDGQPRLGAPD